MNPTWNPSPALTMEWPRPRVTGALLAALSQPLVLLCAAAGYGKTVAGHSVWHAWPGRKAWWTVGATDQEAQHGVASLVGAARQAWGLAPGGDRTLATLLAELTQAEGGLLVIDDISSWPSAALWGALGQLVAAMTAPCRLLLLCRHAPPLPVTLWRSQGRLHWFDHQLLRLDTEEWQMAGFDGGAEACEQACGWWGAEIAARTAPASPWNPALAAWLYEAWFAPLPPSQQAVIGLASLLPDIGMEELAALSGQSTALAWSAWAELRAQGGPVLQEADRLYLAPRYRLYAAQAWRRSDSEAWALAVARGIDYLLARDEGGRAARLADESGLVELQDKVLARAGWTLLYGRDRAALGQLLRQSLSQSPQTVILQCAWQIEVDKVPHRAEATLLKLLPTLDGELRGQALALLTSMSWQYDDFPSADAWSAEALDSFPGDLHPAYALALLGRANALAGLGRLGDGEALLRRAQAHATRDGLPLLQLEILQRRAAVAAECADTAVALTLLTEAGHLAREEGLDSARILDSGGRLQAWLQLQSLDIATARETLATTARWAENFGEYWSFPHQLLHALCALADDQIVEARERVEWMQQRLGEQFHCHKWQNEAALARLWLAARQLDRTRLLQLERELASCAWGAGLHRDRRRVLLAAARLLADAPDDEEELQALQRTLQAQGALALAQTLALVRALRSGDRTELLQCVRESATSGHRFDYIWLGNRSVGPLERLLGAPELIHDARALGFLRQLVQRLLSPGAREGVQPAPQSEPPAGLTGKEWQILQLIGRQLTNEQIAAQLFVSMATVKTHINHLYGKLDIRTRAEAVHRARTLGS